VSDFNAFVFRTGRLGTCLSKIYSITQSVIADMAPLEFSSCVTYNRKYSRKLDERFSTSSNSIIILSSLTIQKNSSNVFLICLLTIHFKAMLKTI
jgi:hypothetical protein